MKRFMFVMILLLFVGQAFGEEPKEITSPDSEQTEIALAPRRLGERANRFDAFNQFGTAEAAPSSGYILLSGTTDKLLLSGTTDALLTSQ